jgi:hypothetical protein
MKGSQSQRNTEADELLLMGVQVGIPEIPVTVCRKRLVAVTSAR